PPRCPLFPYTTLFRSRLDRLNAFNQFWSVTITPYGEDIEPFVPPKENVMTTFKTLSEKVGLNRISWRYDPIFITENYSVDFHLRDRKSTRLNSSHVSI